MTDSNDRTSNAAPPLPEAQDAGHAPRITDVHTRPPLVPPPLTSSTGTGFNAPDAGISPPDQSGSQPTTSQPEALRNTLPKPGNIDRDALVGEESGPGSQANAEAVASTGPISD
jgi:hypothetical protein